MVPICSICCERFTPDAIVKITKCGHIFHRGCILPWMRGNPHCPECRQFGPILYRVYLNFRDFEANESESGEGEAYIAETQRKLAVANIMLEIQKRKLKTYERRIQELEETRSKKKPVAVEGAAAPTPRVKLFKRLKRKLFKRN